MCLMPQHKKYGSYLHKTGGSALAQIVKNDALMLVTHPVVNRLVKRKWDEFAKQQILRRSVGYFIFGNDVDNISCFCAKG